MGFDVVCAVCAGPTFAVQIAKRSPRVRQPRNRDLEDLENLEESSEDEYGYDPKIVSEADVAWTGSCHLLGFNARSTTIDKTYITGPGCRYEDYGCFNSIDEGDDPNLPEDSHNFQWVLCSNENLDKDVLYHTMSNLHLGSSECLSLDYGEPDNEFDQYWSSKSGIEA
ncbi:hypothetical protein C8R43DRAFT_1193668 [Mycena crocata]|nr:hypothetical protein C8R43DRAFT_1193668 [Mycena crocata]